MILPDPPLLVITDRRMAERPLADIAKAVFDGGGRWLMVREKDLPASELAELVNQIGDLAKGAAATVVVNGDARVAADRGAGGVHLPQGHSVPAARRLLGGDRLVGVSSHTRGEAQIAAAAGADYITLSPVFATGSKPGYGPPLGLDELRRTAWHVEIPVVALGGVGAANAADCLRHGAAGVAVMGAVMRAADPRAATEALIAALAG